MKSTFNRTLVFALVFAIITCFSTAQASGTNGIAYQDLEVASHGTDCRITAYKMCFMSGIKISSEECRSNFECVSSKLSEIDFCVDAGNDVFTFFYYCLPGTITYDDVISEIGKAVESTVLMICTDERLQGNHLFSLEDVELKSITICLPQESSESGELGWVFENLTGIILNSEENTEKNAQQNAIGRENKFANQTARSYTIGGSYHYLLSVGNTVKRYWHNQIAGTDYECNVTEAVPHKGDGNNRYDSGFPWIPDIVQVSFITDSHVNRNTTTLWYCYGEDNLNNLVQDANEALEVEVLFYNYANATNINERGCSYQIRILSNSVATTNQPNSYYDTTFLDDGNEMSFCVGVKDTTDLEANHWYFWSIEGTKGTHLGYANDGRFRVAAQRGYRTIEYPFLPDAHTVFCEEHEPTKRLGIPSGANWVPANQNAWILAQNNTSWTFNASTSPVT